MIQLGTIKSEKPSVSAAVAMNLFRRFQRTVERILRPETITEVNRKVVMPPMTEGGSTVIAAPNFEQTPARNRMKQAAYPARREAQPLSAITPYRRKKRKYTLTNAI